MDWIQLEDMKTVGQPKGAEIIHYRLSLFIHEEEEAQRKDATVSRCRMIKSSPFTSVWSRKASLRRWPVQWEGTSRGKGVLERICMVGILSKESSRCVGEMGRRSGQSGWARWRKALLKIKLLLLTTSRICSQAAWLEGPTAWLSLLDSQQVACRHQASFSSAGHPQVRDDLRVAVSWLEILGRMPGPDGPAELGLGPGGPWDAPVNPLSDEGCLMVQNVFKMQSRCWALFYMQYQEEAYLLGQTGLPYPQGHHSEWDCTEIDFGGRWPPGVRRSRPRDAEGTSTLSASNGSSCCSLLSPMPTSCQACSWGENKVLQLCLLAGM